MIAKKIVYSPERRQSTRTASFGHPKRTASTARMITEPIIEAPKRKNHLILVRGFVVHVLSKLANEGNLFSAKRGQNIIKAHDKNGRIRKYIISFLLVWFSTQKIRPMKIGKYDMTIIRAAIERMRAFCVQPI
jgi:hypothetical protein